jgi:hypothetical protein
VVIPDLPTDSIYLSGVSAQATNDVWAVGYYFDNFQGVQVSLVLHWDGNGWRVSPSPNPSTGPPSLVGVEAVAADDVWAVGSAYAYLIQRYHDPYSP